MKNKYFSRIFPVLLLVVLFLAPVWVGAEDGGADSTGLGDFSSTYPIMRPDRETLREWIRAYERAPQFSIKRFGISRPLQGSQNLIDYLQYTPEERDQGSCGNCWAWAGTGVMEIDLSVNEGIRDRLSVQYLNSCKSTGNYACCGGNMSRFKGFYRNNPRAVPWSNTNGSYADATQRCGDGASSVSCGDIPTEPGYPIESISVMSIETMGVSREAAIDNIKAVLDANKAVSFAFYLADDADWYDFFDFWRNEGESALWDPNPYCGHTWLDEEGGGHAVLCVGYNDEDPDPANHYWIILNSWGANDGRPNGLFRMKMDIDYSCWLDDTVSGPFYALYWETLNIEWGEGEEGTPCDITYRYTDAMPYAFDDISTTGTPLGLGDEGYAYFSIPFTFRFYCEDYTAVAVGSNGLIYFIDDASGYKNVCIPGANEDGIPAFIAPLWDDLNPGRAGEIYIQVKGNAPNRKLVVQWEGVPHYSGDGTVTFQAILCERNGAILFQYQDVDFGDASYDDGASATVGIQLDPSTGTGYSCDRAALSDKHAILFAPVNQTGSGDTGPVRTRW